jgi:drug/metabolite transporter (DMT)-like permease
MNTARSWIWYYLGIGIVWGSSFLLIKGALDFLTPAGVTFIRCVCGAFTLLALCAVRHESLPRDPTVWGHLLVMSLTMNVIPGVLLAFAETQMTTITASILNALTPLVTLVFMIVIFKNERVHFHHTVGLVVGLMGVVIVLGIWRGIEVRHLWALAAVLGSVILTGMSFPYTNQFIISKSHAPVSLAAAQLILASLILAVPFALVGFNGHPASAGGVIDVVALGVLASGFAYAWNFTLQRNAGSAVASSVIYLTPVVAAVEGVVFLHEALKWYEPVGCALVIFGAAIGQGRFQAVTSRFRTQ